MSKLLLIASLAIIATHVLGLPADGGKEVHINDVASKLDQVEVNLDQLSTESPPSIKTEAPFRPQHAGTMFARFIDDIFQIPITVLQSVSKLITNPFKHQPQQPASN